MYTLMLVSEMCLSVRLLFEVTFFFLSLGTGVYFEYEIDNFTNIFMVSNYDNGNISHIDWLNKMFKVQS